MNHAQTESFQDRATSGVHRMASTAEQIIETGADRVEGAINSAADKAADMRSSLQDTSAELLKEAQAAYDRVLTEGRKRTDQLEKDIKKAPFTAIAIAFLGGVVLASLVKR